MDLGDRGVLPNMGIECWDSGTVSFRNCSNRLFCIKKKKKGRKRASCFLFLSFVASPFRPHFYCLNVVPLCVVHLLFFFFFSPFFLWVISMVTKIRFILIILFVFTFLFWNLLLFVLKSFTFTFYSVFLLLILMWGLYFNQVTLYNIEKTDCARLCCWWRMQNVNPVKYITRKKKIHWEQEWWLQENILGFFDERLFFVGGIDFSSWQGLSGAV